MDNGCEPEVSIYLLLLLRRILYYSSKIRVAKQYCSQGKGNIENIPAKDVGDTPKNQIAFSKCRKS